MSGAQRALLRRPFPKRALPSTGVASGFMGGAVCVCVCVCVRACERLLLLYLSFTICVIYDVFLVKVE